MRLVRVEHPRPAGAGADCHPALEAIDPRALRATVEALAYPRHAAIQPSANVKARDWICAQFTQLGCAVHMQGICNNVIAAHPGSAPPVLVLGSHYDTVPATPGADDNASAIALCLELARIFAPLAPLPVQWCVFNAEEDNLAGSTAFVAEFVPGTPPAETHIFEMVGYYTTVPGSQTKPAALPIDLPDTGHFIGVVGNHLALPLIDAIADSARRLGSNTPLITLALPPGAELHFADLLRSDHAPFWRRHLPAVLWTDTANFRNPHYHKPSDTPDTLNYAALADVTRLVAAHVLRSLGRL